MKVKRKGDEIGKKHDLNKMRRPISGGSKLRAQSLSSPFHFLNHVVSICILITSFIVANLYYPIYSVLRSGGIDISKTNT